MAARNIATVSSAGHATHTGRGLPGYVTLKRHVESSEEERGEGERGEEMGADEGCLVGTPIGVVALFLGLGGGTTREGESTEA